MKVLISVVGRFHAFDLAKQLKRKNLLYKLNTTYPGFFIRRWGLKRRDYHSNIILELFIRYGSNIKFIRHTIHKLQSLSNYFFIKNADIYIGWTEGSLEAIEKARKESKITIIERGCSHYTYQMNILIEEYKLYGKEFPVDKWVWDREILEYKAADYISIPSLFAKRTFLEQGFSEEKLLVNPYGVDLNSFRKVKKKDDVFRIISSGSLSIRKGSRYLLEAFAELDLPNCELWHIGSIHEDIRDWLDNYKNDKVHFLGHQPQEKLFEYYSQGSVYVLMTVEDGFAMVLIQAMACGLPIITTVNSGGPDLVTENGKEGFIVQIRDVEKLKEYITLLYSNNELRERMSENAIERVREGFTWDDYGDRYIDNLYKIYNKD